MNRPGSFLFHFLSSSASLRGLGGGRCLRRSVAVARGVVVVVACGVVVIVACGDGRRCLWRGSCGCR